MTNCGPKLSIWNDSLYNQWQPILVRGLFISPQKAYCILWGMVKIHAHITTTTTWMISIFKPVLGRIRLYPINFASYNSVRTTSMVRKIFAILLKIFRDQGHNTVMLRMKTNFCHGGNKGNLQIDRPRKLNHDIAHLTIPTHYLPCTSIEPEV